MAYRPHPDYGYLQQTRSQFCLCLLVCLSAELMLKFTMNFIVFLEVMCCPATRYKKQPMRWQQWYKSTCKNLFTLFRWRLVKMPLRTSKSYPTSNLVSTQTDDCSLVYRHGMLCHRPSRKTQHPAHSKRENEHRPKYGDALWLRRKTGTARSTQRWNRSRFLWPDR